MSIPEITPQVAVGANPFDLADDAAYRRWRDWKLNGYPSSIGGLIVEIGDLSHVSDAEHDAILARIRKTNMALYVAKGGDFADKAIQHRLGARFGLSRLDANLCADDDGITPLHVVAAGSRVRYISYTDRPIKWHTDGYYNVEHEWIRGLVLHCVRPAAEGGVNALLDHEVAYIALRDHDPDLVAALMHPQAMTIPANEQDGQAIRGARTNPVFSVDPVTGTLHMAFSERKRNLVWRDDAATRAAVSFLTDLLHGDHPAIFRHRMEPGQGLICNNVLHDRSAFRDSTESGKGRLLYRARYFDRIAGTGLDDTWPLEART